MRTDRRGRDHFGDVFEGCRLAVAPTLGTLATEPDQHVGLLFGFHTLGNHFQVEALAEADDRRDDLAAVALGRDARDEAAIDLQGVETQRLQMPKIGISCPEIIEGQPASHVFQSTGHLLRPL